MKTAPASAGFSHSPLDESNAKSMEALERGDLETAKRYAATKEQAMLVREYEAAAMAEKRQRQEKARIDARHYGITRKLNSIQQEQARQERERTWGSLGRPTSYRCRPDLIGKGATCDPQ